MADFRRDNRNGGGYRGGGNRGGRGGYGGNRGGRGDREMHQATCDKCGNDCQVPFRPSGDKPVYCKDCFERTDDRGGRSSGGYSNDRGPRGGGARSNGPDYSKQFDVLNRKLDAILEILEGAQIVEGDDDDMEDDSEDDFDISEQLAETVMEVTPEVTEPQASDEDED